MTLEEAQNKIIELTDQLNDMTTDRDRLSKENEDLNSECNTLRELNQKYFNRIIAQDSKTNEAEEDADEDPPTCEEFAATLNI